MNWFRRLFHRYDDYKECGAWGSYNPLTKEVSEGGKMYSRTIKVEKEDGTVGMDTEWITDRDMEQEKNGGPPTGPADPPAPPVNPDDPTLEADWWKKG